MIRSTAAWVSVLIAGLTSAAPPAPAGTAADPVVDSRMTVEEVFDGLSAECPKDLRDRQAVLAVLYYGFDGKVHRGQVVLDNDLVDDVGAVFRTAFDAKFPITSVVPVSHPTFRKDGRWSDDLSMAADNTSCFNYRRVTGGTGLSKHALGRAIDINPRINPYFKGATVLPPGAKYDPTAPGTLTADHPVTKAFLARGWVWGGNWTSPKDYQHFEKPADAKPTWTRPAALRPGDTIAFVAPAGGADPELVGKAKARFEALGFKVQVPSTLTTRRLRYLAGEDAERADEFNAAIKDPKVRAVFSVKGGFGISRILDRIDYKAVKANPKIVAGFSDPTAFHLAIAKECRLVTFHAPMPQFGLWRPDADGPYGYSSDLFWRTIRADHYPAGGGGFAVPLPAERPRPKTLVPGVARGRLVGGNLSLVAATVGTPYQIEPDGNILLLEDTGEKAYRVDRMLSTMRLAGLLDRFSGVVLGTFDGTDDADLAAVVKEYFGGLKVPVLTDFPVGHTAYNATLPHGGWVELNATTQTITLLESPVVVK